MRVKARHHVRENLGYEAEGSDGGLPCQLRRGTATSRSRPPPLYGPLAELAREGFTGTVAELHARPDSMASNAMRRSVRWPKAPNGLGNALERLATALRAAGVELQFSRYNVQRRRLVSVVAAAQIRETSSVAVSSRQ
jgi:hypothetical protein